MFLIRVRHLWIATVTALTIGKLKLSLLLASAGHSPQQVLSLLPAVT